MRFVIMITKLISHGGSLKLEPTVEHVVACNWGKIWKKKKKTTKTSATLPPTNVEITIAPDRDADGRETGFPRFPFVTGSYRPSNYRIFPRLKSAFAPVSPRYRKIIAGEMLDLRNGTKKKNCIFHIFKSINLNLVFEHSRRLNEIMRKNWKKNFSFNYEYI